MAQGIKDRAACDCVNDDPDELRFYCHFFSAPVLWSDSGSFSSYVKLIMAFYA
jgi:hypothetical protein